MLYISDNATKSNFSLLRVMSEKEFCVVNFVEVERQVLSCQVRYINDAYALSTVEQQKKYGSDGLYFRLVSVSAEEYQKYERIVKRHLNTTLFKKKIYEN